MGDFTAVGSRIMSDVNSDRSVSVAPLEALLLLLRESSSVYWLASLRPDLMPPPRASSP